MSSTDTTTINEVPTRIPRPKGCTVAMRRLASLPPNKKKTQLTQYKKYLLTQYVLNGMVVNGESMDLEGFSMYLNLPYKRCISLLGVVTTDIGQPLQTTGLQDTYRALMVSAIKNSLADRGRAEQQYEALYRAQEDKDGIIRYKPFVSGTVNDAMRNLFGANRVTIDLMKGLVPNPDTILNVNLNTQNNNWIGTDEALVLIRKEQGTIPEYAISNEQLYQDHQLADTPDLIPLNTIATDGAKVKLPTSTGKDHGDRRLEEAEATEID